MPPRGSKNWKPKPQTPDINEADGTARIPLFHADDSVTWARVDVEDLPTVMAYRWREYVSDDGRASYAFGRRRDAETGRRVETTMHKLLLAPRSGMHVDHKDGDGLNNTRANIRIATPGQNRGNERQFRGGRCPYKGVSLEGDAVWVALIGVGGARQHLGRFDDPVSAALAYDEAARECYGEFACTNFTEDEAATLPRVPRRPTPIGRPHGVSGYRNGCRCRDCTDAAVAYSRLWRARRKARRAALREAS